MPGVQLLMKNMQTYKNTSNMQQHQRYQRAIYKSILVTKESNNIYVISTQQIYGKKINFALKINERAYNHFALVTMHAFTRLAPHPQ